MQLVIIGTLVVICISQWVKIFSLVKSVREANYQIAELKRQKSASEVEFGKTFEELHAEYKKYVAESESVRSEYKSHKENYMAMIKLWDQLQSNCETMRSCIISMLIEQILEKVYDQIPEYRDRFWFKVKTKRLGPLNTESTTNVTIGLEQEEISFDHTDDFVEQLTDAMRKLAD